MDHFKFLLKLQSLWLAARIYFQVTSLVRVSLGIGGEGRQRVTIILGFLVLGGVPGLVSPEQAAAAPPLDEKTPLMEVATEDEGLFHRDTLLGDWGGLRPALGERGITWDLSYTAIYAGVFDGGARDQDFDWGHRADAFIRADTGRLGAHLLRGLPSQRCHSASRKAR